MRGLFVVPIFRKNYLFFSIFQHFPDLTSDQLPFFVLCRLIFIHLTKVFVHIRRRSTHIDHLFFLYLKISFHAEEVFVRIPERISHIFMFSSTDFSPYSALFS